jgi:antitoxin ParD1/3/4
MSPQLLVMNVSLTPQLEEFVAAKVRSGRYTSASEVVREALRLLQEEDHVRELRIKSLKNELRVGTEQLERGESAPLDMDEIRKSARKKLAARRKRQ